MSRALMLGLLLAVLAAAALRCPQLGIRPMHNDEAVNAIKLRALWEKGSYQYDPQEYHGPTLLYGTWLWVKIIGPTNFVDFTETQLRLVAVLFGLGLILLLPLVADGLGPRATLWTAVLMAVSPAMVFYSRYFIHEMLLVFFGFLLLASGWRYSRNGRARWALLSGAAAGLMQATKETFVFTLAAMAAALVLNAVWKKSPAQADTGFRFQAKHAVWALGVWLAVAAVLFSSFFTHAQGPLDAVRTYSTWLNRAGGASPHIHPWYYYLGRLAWFQSGKGPVFSEGLILALSLIGIVAAFAGRGLAEGNAVFIRWLAIYTILLTAIYSGISYKTPWCLLSFWHGMILLAGVGAVVLLNWLKRRSLKIVVGLLLSAAAWQLSYQAGQSAVTYAADPKNPWVYAQTSPDILNLVARVNELALASPQKDAMLIKVMAPEAEYWPLPWYLRRFTQVGWYENLPPDPFAPVMIVSTKFNAGLDADKTHLMAGISELRPAVFLELYAETNLWRARLALIRPAE